MLPIIEAVTEPIELSEGPFWNSQNQTLYYVGIYDASIHSYNTVTKEHHSVKIGGNGDSVSLVIPVEGQDDKFLATITHDIVLVTWDGVSSKPSSVEIIATIEGKEEGIRINDGKIDPAGRFWTGTVGRRKVEGVHDFEMEKAALYRINKDLTITKLVDKISMSNGMAWSLESNKMYYIDTLQLKVFSYDYNIVTGDIANGKTLLCYKENNIDGCPDGMTIDEEGKLWVACYEGAQVLRIDPDTGRVLYTLKMPSQQVTSVVFGGPNLDELYVTTAKLSISKELLEKYPKAGSVFRVTNLGVRGTPSLKIKL